MFRLLRCPSPRPRPSSRRAASRRSNIRGRMVGSGSVSYLGRPSHWETGGDYDAAWRIVDNIPHREPWAEIEVHG